MPLYNQDCHSLFCLKTRKFNDIPIKRSHRWTIYIIGLLETFVFSGCIFGWAQLVYVLKNEEIFLDLCWKSTDNYFNGTEISEATKLNISMEEMKLQGCPEQDRRFGLIYTIGCVFFSGTGILSGFIIHHYGLVVSRTFAAIALSGGFLALGFLTKDNTQWLYVSVILLSYGGNQLRLSGFQFCNLFPKNKSTALTIISGSYAASAGLFLMFQAGQSYGLSLKLMSICLVIVSFLSFLASSIMPWHHVPYERSNEYTEEKIPFRDSLFSFSTFTYYLWFVMIVLGLRFYTLTFNPWISGISQSNEEAGVYSYLFSVSCFLCPLATPLPGILNDFLSRKARTSAGTDKEKFLLKDLQTPVWTLSIILILAIILNCCLLFHHYIAVYTTLIILIIVRPCIVSVGTAFVRIRFPPEHFDRLNGICGAFVSVFTFLQYPLFLWVQKSPFYAIASFTFLMMLAFLHPFHLLSKRYRKKVARKRFQNVDKEENLITT